MVGEIAARMVSVGVVDALKGGGGGGARGAEPQGCRWSDGAPDLFSWAPVTSLFARSDPVGGWWV